MPQREYASKKYALKGLCLRGTPFDSYAKRGDASKKYALKGKCLKKLCPKGTMPPKTMPFYCTTHFSGKLLKTLGIHHSGYWKIEALMACYF